MKEEFNNDVRSIVKRAIEKAKKPVDGHPDMPYRGKIPISRGMITYALSEFKSPLNDGAWLTVFIEELTIDRSFYDIYVECCKTHKKKPNEAHFVKTFMVVQFFCSIQRKQLTDVGFQVHVSGVHPEKGNFSTDRLIGRYVSRPYTGGYGFLKPTLRYPDLSEPMKEILAKEGNAVSIMKPGDQANMVFPYPAILDYLVNYM